MSSVVLFEFKTKEPKLKQTTSQQEELVSEQQRRGSYYQSISQSISQSINHIIKYDRTSSDHMAVGTIRYNQKKNETCFSPRSFLLFRLCLWWMFAALWLQTNQPASFYISASSSGPTCLTSCHRFLTSFSLKEGKSDPERNKGRCDGLWIHGLTL